MARKRYVIVDLSAGPCLLGSLGVGEGTVSVSEHRVDFLYGNHRYAKPSERKRLDSI